MGIFHSKVAPANLKEERLNNQLDPRSPTVNINRSPIGSEPAAQQDKPIITKVRDLTSDLTVILDSAQTPDRGSGMPIGEKLQSLLDPRSPGTFDRTPLVLDDSVNASNVSLCGTSLEYEEISGCYDEDKSLSFKDCEEVVVANGTATTGLFSDMSLNSELQADIETIIQSLYDNNSTAEAGAGKDPRSPSINIQRTPIVFEEDEQGADQEAKEERQQEEPPTNTTHTEKPLAKVITVIHRDDENEATPATTPAKEKTELLKSASNSASRTPLGCVTNLKQAASSNVSAGVQNNMRKTALFGQMKQNAAAAVTATASANEQVPTGRRSSFTRSKIPTLRMK